MSPVNSKNKYLLPLLLVLVLFYFNIRQTQQNSIKNQKTVINEIATSTSSAYETKDKENENIQQDINEESEKTTKNSIPVTKDDDKKLESPGATSSTSVIEKKDNVLKKQPISTNSIAVDFSKINENTRKALVNIICSPKAGIPLSPITGSGIFVSSDGVILTNAHIGQYFLLKDFNEQKDSVECVIRTGSPAYPMYIAKMVYISPDWIENNKTVLIDKNPVGTGEYDYAFLKITKKIDGSSLPLEFPFVPMGTEENIEIGSPVLLASYPAGFLGGIAILQYLYQSSAEAKISDRFTFKEGTVDLISVAGTILSQKGSSGGAVINSSGELIGLISTSGDAPNTSARDLRSITGVYIERDLLQSTGFGISHLIQNSDQVSGNFFETKVSSILKILTDSVMGK